MSKKDTYIDILKIKLLSNDYLSIYKAFIRGSYAYGNYNDKSDLDLLLISDDFIGIDIMKRKQLVKSIFQSSLCMKIDSICLTRYEYGLIIVNKEKDIRHDEMVEVI